MSTVIFIIGSPIPFHSRCGYGTRVGADDGAALRSWGCEAHSRVGHAQGGEDPRHPHGCRQLCDMPGFGLCRTFTHDCGVRGWDGADVRQKAASQQQVGCGLEWCGDSSASCPDHHYIGCYLKYEQQKSCWNSEK